MTNQIEVNTNGLWFAALVEGPEDGPLGLCLHGFPDSAHTWRYLLPDLAEAGLRALTPWMRGYAPTAVPDGSYGVRALTADACALHEALSGDERAMLIGHDSGAFAAYGAATSRQSAGASRHRRHPAISGYRHEAVRVRAVERSF
jgi:pimeloyl-ACP methyl ester carboxylesterase